MTTVCSCGHHQLAHPGAGPCMEMECNCVLLEEPTSSPYDRVNRAHYGDALWDDLQAHQARLRENTEWQGVWTASRLTADVEVREAFCDLLTAVRWLLVVCVPLLVAITGWAVIA